MISATTFFIYWLPPLLLMAFMFPKNQALSSGYTFMFLAPLIKWILPWANTALIEFAHIIFRKAGHFLEYAFLSLLLFRAARSGRSDIRLVWLLYAGILPVSYAALDEVLQTRIAVRTGSLSDWMIDAAGVLCMLGIIVATTGTGTGTGTGKEKTGH